VKRSRPGNKLSLAIHAREFWIIQDQFMFASFGQEFHQKCLLQTHTWLAWNWGAHGLNMAEQYINGSRCAGWFL